MRWIKTILGEMLGLFVDDGSFAVSILIWLALALLLVPIVHAEPAWAGIILFVGLAIVLIENVLRSARRQPQRG